jgi:hypothetical protein
MMLLFAAVIAIILNPSLALEQQAQTVEQYKDYRLKYCIGSRLLILERIGYFKGKGRDVRIGAFLYLKNDCEAWLNRVD